MPAVSIITPAYRAGSHIARAVRSVLAQTMGDWEMVIAADDETDYRQCLLEQGIEDTRLRFVNTGGVQNGISSARNAATFAASSDIIATLDADDEFLPMKLERMVPLAAQYGFCTCVFDYVRYEDGKCISIGMVGETDEDRCLGPSDYLNVHYSANAMMVYDRRQTGHYWREDLPAMEDLTFSMSAFNHLPAVWHINEPLHRYVCTPNSFSNSAEAPKRFIAAKKMLLERLAGDGIGIKNPVARTAFTRFLAISLETEEEYAQAMRDGRKITFTELLKENLFD